MHTWRHQWGIAKVVHVGVSSLHRLYCQIPMLSTSSRDFLYCLQGEPLGGGQVVASGRVWVAPQAEQDARAVRVTAEGRRLPFDSVALRYLPQVPHQCWLLSCWTLSAGTALSHT